MLRRFLEPDPAKLEPARFSEPLTAEVSRLLADGKRIEAIKLVRERTGLGLTLAVRAVDAVDRPG